jgi:hypothetical protein
MGLRTTPFLRVKTVQANWQQATIKIHALKGLAVDAICGEKTALFCGTIKQ